MVKLTVTLLESILAVAEGIATPEQRQFVLEEVAELLESAKLAEAKEVILEDFNFVIEAPSAEPEAITIPDDVYDRIIEQIAQEKNLYPEDVDDIIRMFDEAVDKWLKEQKEGKE